MAGAPVQVTEQLRPASVPVGPGAPGMSVMGPSPNARAAFGPGFGPLLGPDWVALSGRTDADRFFGGAGMGIWNFAASYVSSMDPGQSVLAIGQTLARAVAEDGGMNVFNPSHMIHEVGALAAGVYMAGASGDWDTAGQGTATLLIAWTTGGSLYSPQPTCLCRSDGRRLKK